MDLNELILLNGPAKIVLRILFRKQREDVDLRSLLRSQIR